MYVGCTHIRIPEQLTDLPVPVCTKAIAPAIPDAEYEPGKRGERQYNKVDQTPSRNEPPKYIE